MALHIERLDVLRPSGADRRAFDCGVESLNDWFANQAGQSLKKGDAVTFVLHDDGQILGYYCASAGSVERQELPATQAQGAPVVVPVMLIGRLAVTKHYQHRGYGQQLLAHAVRGALESSEALGIRSILVQALDGAVDFYLRNGFEPSPMSEFTFMLHLRDVRRSQRR